MEAAMSKRLTLCRLHRLNAAALGLFLMLHLGNHLALLGGILIVAELRASLLGAGPEALNGLPVAHPAQR